MLDRQLSPPPDPATNGVYKFPSSYVLLLAGFGLAALLFSAMLWARVAAGKQSVYAGLQIASLLLSAVAVYLIAKAVSLRGRTLEITGDAIQIKNARGEAIANLPWAELAKVTERRKMHQLALWDHTGVRRVLVDQQYEKFDLIRSRILDEYSRVFVLKPFPIELLNPDHLPYESTVYALIAALFFSLAWLSFRQSQELPAIFFFSLALLGLWSLLNLYPRLAGPSVLYVDHLVLRNIYKTTEIRRSDVTALQIEDVASRNGDKFSRIVLHLLDGRKIKITARYGSIPDLYVILRAWLCPDGQPVSVPALGGSASLSVPRSRGRAWKLQILAHLLWLLIPLYFYARLLGSSAFLDSLHLAESSPDVQRALGPRIHLKTLPVGSALPKYHSEFAEWSVTLAGSLGSGRLYGVANKIGRDWQFSRLILVPANGGPKIDLTPDPARVSLPSETRKTVYLVPLDLLPEEFPAWAPAYYKALFDAPVRILPPVAPTSSEVDRNRRQLIAEKCVDLVARSYPSLAADPSAILIAVTSRDMFIASYNWNYAENFREGDRAAIVSSARMEPTSFPGKWNRELRNSRLQKMITKNLAMLYFALPLSNDYTSLLSAGVLSGEEIDYMTRSFVGAEGRWDSFVNPGAPFLTLVAHPDSPLTWGWEGWGPLPEPRAEFFTVDLSAGLFAQHKIDFILGDDYPFQFTRSFRNLDQTSRAFGIGANHSFDIFLAGQMESYVDLVGDSGDALRFTHVDTGPKGIPELYRPSGGPFIQAVYDMGVWRVTSKDGWTFLFPYRPNWKGSHVTVLTGFIDPHGRHFNMVRNDSGDLLSVADSSGRSLRFEYDDSHRIRSIRDSAGPSMEYAYDPAGHLIRVTDSSGHFEAYSYNQKNEMLSAANGSDAPFLINQYTPNNLISRQTLPDGRYFEYSYTFGASMMLPKSAFKDPSGFRTQFEYLSNGYRQSLPTRLSP